MKKRSHLIIITINSVWAVFVIAHIILRGNSWLLSLTSFFPQFLFIVVSGALLSINITLYIRKKSSIILTYITIGLVFLSVPLSGLNIHALGNLTQQNEPGDITLVNWNTLFWEENPEDMYELLRSYNADIYTLQEYMFIDYRGDTVIRSDPDMLEGLQNTFPEYTIQRHEELITLSRLPVIESNELALGYGLYTKIMYQNTTITVYNVHIPVHINVRKIDQPLAFLRDTQDRYRLRKAVIHDIEKSLQGHSHAEHIILSGDFNTSSAMSSRLFPQLDQNAMHKSRYLFPNTWRTHPFPFWRIDYILGKNIAFNTYDEIFAPNLSDHAMLISTLHLNPQ